MHRLTSKEMLLCGCLHDFLILSRFYYYYTISEKKVTTMKTQVKARKAAKVSKN